MNQMQKYKKELVNTLQNYIIPFWLEKSEDKLYGGYLTSFDENGLFEGDGEKNIVTQSRMVWGFSHLIEYAKDSDKDSMKKIATQGAMFLIDKFWDKEHGGFYWLLNRDGSVKDSSKLTYGEGFAIYALSEYYLVFKAPWALEYASKCFDYIQKYSTDTQHGGYYENIESDWSISPSGPYAGDRKSLDIHMHLLEAFTTLYKASGEEIHKRKLIEVYNLIFDHMVNVEKGYGYNQFDLSFNKIPAINILRTWNAERETNEKVEIPTDTTSYGHNLELTWLGDEALSVIGERKKEDNIFIQKVIEHSLQYGFDFDNGGIYREGVADQKVLVFDKEWWQNFEAMTGFLNGYILFNDEKYFDAFVSTWNFIDKYFMNYEVGESRQLLTIKGDIIVGNVGNLWKGIYHTGRALAECISRLDKFEN
jgi:mannobiose 2-epimerase